MNTLTRKQSGVLDFMVEHFRAEDKLPTSREIQRRFGYRSQTGAMSHIKALVRHGYIERRTNGCQTSYRFSREWKERP